MANLFLVSLNAFSDIYFFHVLLIPNSRLSMYNYNISHMRIWRFDSIIFQIHMNANIFYFHKQHEMML